MDRWEYGLLRKQLIGGDRKHAEYGYVFSEGKADKVVTTSDDRPAFLIGLQTLGGEGWEVICPCLDGFLLKRHSARP